MGVEPTEVFARSRAGDEQLWVALVSSGDACSMLVDPRATVVARTEHDAQALIADIGNLPRPFDTSITFNLACNCYNIDIFLLVFSILRSSSEIEYASLAQRKAI